MQVFIFSNKIKYYLFIYIFDVVKMVIIHKKVTTFGYTRVV
jgi:hypothetical protein